MDELIEVFLSENFTPEKKAVVLQAFSVLEAHMHPDPYSDICELILLELDTSTRIDMVEGVVEKMIDTLLQQYTIVATDEADLEIKCKVIQAVMALTDPEYPEAVLTKLEGLSSDLEKFCSLLVQFSDFEECDALLYVKEIRPEFLHTLKVHLYQQEESNIATAPEVQCVMQNIRLLIEKHDRPLVGGEMVKAGVLVNMPFETYIPLIDPEDLGTDLEVSALNMLSVILLSERGMEHAVQIFREHGSKIYPDVKVATEIEQNLQRQLSDFNEYLKFKHEKAGISQTS